MSKQIATIKFTPEASEQQRYDITVAVREYDFQVLDVSTNTVAAFEVHAEEEKPPQATGVTINENGLLLQSDTAGLIRYTTDIPVRLGRLAELVFPCELSHAVNVLDAPIAQYYVGLADDK